MMNTLEREIVEKFHQLDREAQQRVRKLIDYEIAPTQQDDAATFDYDAWFRDVEAIRQEIRANHGNEYVPSASELLNEVREERDAEILRSLGFGDSAGDGAN